MGQVESHVFNSLEQNSNCEWYTESLAAILSERATPLLRAQGAWMS